MQNTNQPQLVKARLNTGETLWVEVGEDFAQIANIPISTAEYAYHDLVLLVEGADGVSEIAERLEPSGCKAAIFLAPKDDPEAVKFLNNLAGIALSERIDENECVITAKGEDWNTVLRLAGLPSAN